MPPDLASLDPRLPARRILDRLDQGLHARAAAKVERLGPLPGKAIEKSRNLDGFQVIEAELMTGSDAEEAVGIMIRPGLDAAKAAAPGRIRHAVEMQLVEALLREAERAFGPVDLKIVLHLAAGRNPTRLDAAAGAIRKTQEGAADVIHLDGMKSAQTVGA